MKTEMGNLSAAEWMARLSDTEELTQAEKAALNDFLRDSPAHVREMIEHVSIEADLQELSISQDQLDRWVAEARAQNSNALPFPNPHTSGPQQGNLAHSSRIARWIRSAMEPRVLVAASVAAALAVAALLLHARLGLYSTGFGEQRILTLADGSVVSLNTESKMRVDFSKHRRSIALLEGEAFFRVAKDQERPFFVETGNAVVRAVGTQFNIKMARNNTVVSMVDGVVQVSLSTAEPAQRTGAGRAGESAITLSKGEEAKIDRTEPANGAAATISKIETPAASNAASWTRGWLQFDGVPLAEVLSEFQRYRHFDVEIVGDAARQLKLTGSFEAHDPEAVLAYIATIPGMTVEKKGPNSYFIRRS